MFFRDSVGRGLVEDHGGSSSHGRVNHGCPAVNVLSEQSKQTEDGPRGHDPSAVVALKVVGVNVGLDACFNEGERLEAVEKGV